jgi:hypothetical protein
LKAVKVRFTINALFMPSCVTSLLNNISRRIFFKMMASIQLLNYLLLWNTKFIIHVREACLWTTFSAS